jgi:hypothetical protein
MTCMTSTQQPIPATRAVPRHTMHACLAAAACTGERQSSLQDRPSRMYCPCCGLILQYAALSLPAPRPVSWLCPQLTSDTACSAPLASPLPPTSPTTSPCCAPQAQPAAPPPPASPPAQPAQHVVPQLVLAHKGEVHVTKVKLLVADPHVCSAQAGQVLAHVLRRNDAVTDACRGTGGTGGGVRQACWLWCAKMLGCEVPVLLKS